MAIYSKYFANYYDLLITDYSRLISSIKILIASTRPEKKLRILELGCGTGNILQQLPKSYEIYGLDISPDMIQVAKKKLPHGYFFVADMTNFSLPTKFDVILCVFDSINHLTHFSQWKKVFRLATKHLNKNGVFIFDMNTKKRLHTLSSFKPYIKRLDKDAITIEKLSKTRKDIYTLNITILNNTNSDKITAIEQTVEEAVFDIQKVEETLYKYFSIKKKIDPFRKYITKNTGRIFFACQKKR